VAPPTAEAPYDPFQLSSDTRQASSEFEISFVQDNVLYKYGFKMSSKRVFEESLLEYPANRGRHLFSRRFLEGRNEYEWSFSPFLRGNRALWRDSTRENALFLSTAAQLNSGQLLPVFAWFQRRLVMIPGIASFNAALTLRLLATPEGKRRILPFAREADLGIADIQIQREPFPNIAGRGAAMLIRPSDQVFLDQPTPNAPPEMVKVSFAHKANDGSENIQFDFQHESNGTRALFMSAGAWLNVLQNGEILLFDEIDTSLHPVLTRFLIQQFHSNETNPNGAQLICTTHDTTLLDADIFRRDQVWFVEKDLGGSTRLFPLSDFSPRSNEALERGYLRGRYGALPIIGTLQ
jgi:hypothetical protein